MGGAPKLADPLKTLPFSLENRPERFEKFSQGVPDKLSTTDTPPPRLSPSLREGVGRPLFDIKTNGPGMESAAESPGMLTMKPAP